MGQGEQQRTTSEVESLATGRLGVPWLPPRGRKPAAWNAAETRRLRCSACGSRQTVRRSRGRRHMLASLLAVWAWSTGQASLPWSDVNLLIVTDVHSWVAGHPHKDHT